MMKVWLNVCVWTRYELIEKDKILDHFMKTNKNWPGKVDNKRERVIWLAFCWCVWEKQNKMIFNGVVANVACLDFNI